MEVKNRHHLRKDKAKEIKEELSKKFGEDVLGDKKLEKGEIDDREFILVNGSPLLTKFDKKYFPTVLGALELDLVNNSVIVDQGAIPHVINGADIMAPGVVDVDSDLKENELGIVRENEHNKALAVVKLLVDADEIIEMDKGKVAKTLHHLRDDLWETIEEN